MISHTIIPGTLLNYLQSYNQIYIYKKMNINEQQKNLGTFLNNIPYEYKNQVKNDLIKFVKENDSFWIRTNVQRNNMDQFFSYIQVVGFVNVGKNMIELRIMMPHNYPMAVPQFDLLYSRQSYEIVNQGTLVANGTITIRKNSSNEQMLRLNFQSLKNLWSQGSRRNISQAYRQIFREINNPPLLMQGGRDLNMNRSFRNINLPNKLSRGVSGKLSEQVMNELQSQIFVIQEKVDKVDTLKEDKEYKRARSDFIHRNAEKLEKALHNEQGKVHQELAGLRKKHEDMLLQGSIDPLIQISPQDNLKIQAQARQEAVTEAERKMVQCLEGNLSEGKGRFQDHKTMIRQFYEQMFDAKLMYLKVCD